MIQFDWNQARAFLATAETGSLSAAARKLGLTQPTLSRQVAALEEHLTVTLFERVGKSLQLTAPGVTLLEHARAMGVAADAFALAATGQSETVEGLVSISAADGISHYLLPAMLHRIAREAPGITLKVIVSNSISDLRRREADIAIRHVRPDEPELFGRLIRDVSAGFYASKSWAANHGHPKTARDVRGARFIGFNETDAFASHLRALGLEVDGSSFPLITENSAVAWEMVRQGLGIGVMMDQIAAGMPGVVRILDDLPPISFPIWLVTHRELKTSRRIRLVFDILAEELARE